MDIYYLRPNRLVIEAQNERDRVKLALMEMEIRKLAQKFDEPHEKESTDVNQSK